MSQAAPPYIPETAPFTAEQRAWLNGFFAGLFSGAGQNVTPVVAAPAVPVTILVGTQTGTCESVAKVAAKAMKKKNLAPKIVNMSEYDAAKLATEERVLVITSTYGEGEMPDGAKPLWEVLGADSAPRLETVKFSVLALGDSSYAKFCNAGKLFDERFEALGAKRIFARVDCDKDYDREFETWLDGVLPMLSDVPAATTTDDEPEEETGWSAKKPCPARLVENRKLNAEGSGKDTRHFSIAIDGAGLTYKVGDALGIIPKNCPELVADVLKALGCDGEEGVPGTKGEVIALRRALTEVYDLRIVGKHLLEAIAKTNAELAKLLAPEAKPDLDKYLYGREVIDLLLENPAVKFTAQEFAGLLRKLQHRLYSISSSPKANPGQVHLTVAAVRYESFGRARKGVASNFLADRVGADGPVGIFVQANNHYRLPASGDTPVIMVGPGTGVAPFRAFLQERQATGAKGKNWLFFGDQKSATDFLYREEFDAMKASGVLMRLDTAFSRDQKEKIYVQNRMLENATELFAWLEAGAHFYVCGDANRMAKDVDKALHEVISTVGNMTAEATAEYVKKLAKDKRYQRDVY